MTHSLCQSQMSQSLNSALGAEPHERNQLEDESNNERANNNGQCLGNTDGTQDVHNIRWDHSVIGLRVERRLNSRYSANSNAHRGIKKPAKNIGDDVPGINEYLLEDGKQPLGEASDLGKKIGEKLKYASHDSTSEHQSASGEYSRNQHDHLDEVEHVAEGREVLNAVIRPGRNVDIQAETGAASGERGHEALEKADERAIQQFCLAGLPYPLKPVRVLLFIEGFNLRKIRVGIGRVGIFFTRWLVIRIRRIT